MAKKKGGLGRGIDALFADAEPIVSSEEATDAEKKADTEPHSLKPGNNESQKKNEKTKTKTEAAVSKENESLDAVSTEDENHVFYIDINDIKPNANQPRKKFDDNKIKELADSITANGVIQPLIVRRSENGFELVAGERRWRASRVAGLKSVPCIIRNFDDKQNMIVAIIENMQREDLDPIEEANGLQDMIKKYGFTQEQVSASLGKSRAYIANSIRLLKLSPEIKKTISDGKMSAAHGRTLAGIADEKKRAKLAERIVKEGLSVRTTEKLAEKAKSDKKPAERREPDLKNEEFKAVEDELRRIMGTKVNIINKRSIEIGRVESKSGNGDSGRLEIEYYSMDELNRIIDMLRELA